MIGRKILAATTGFLIMAILLVVAGPINPGAARTTKKPLLEGEMPVPVERTYISKQHSELNQQLLDNWSSKPLPNWKDHHKVTAPRVLLACLVNGKRIDEVNRYIQQQKPAGISGSRWLLNPKGDYDFAQMALMPIIYLFDKKPDILYPETLTHLLDVLIIEDGGGFNLKVPKTLGMVEDTENHILMTEGTRYLKNQWLRNNGNAAKKFDNKANGLEQKLAAYLEEMYRYGVYEFNSDPYIGYTLCALLNLEAFAEEPIKRLSRRILDRMNWQYALGSFNLSRHPPIRRQYEKHANTSIDKDYHSAVMKTWLSFYTDSLNLNIRRGDHIALWAAIMPYRPSDEVINWSVNKPTPYFVQMGHGANSCPEIYSGSSSFMISAGGANQGKRSLILPRPIVLFTNQGERELDETFHLMGPGSDFMQWNNTGVLKDFAVAAGPVNVPTGKTTLHGHEPWRIFELCEKHFLLIYSTPELGLMAICNKTMATAEGFMTVAMGVNPEKDLASGKFIHPDGRMIQFDVKAKRHLWVITHEDGNPVDRDFEKWPDFRKQIFSYM
jgi:hypothetical protein